MTVYLGFYLSNFHNLSTPLKVWNDDAGWAQIIPIVRGVAGAAKLLGMDGIATDSEMYRDDSRQTWNWNYPGVTQDEATVRALARRRGREFMDAVLAGFPNVEINLGVHRSTPTASNRRSCARRSMKIVLATASSGRRCRRTSAASSPPWPSAPTAPFTSV
jgi:hypothetical protein